MTAFSRQSSHNSWGFFTWELRTVNHRFLDLSIRLPEALRDIEPEVRKRLGEKIHRGKVEASLRISSEIDKSSHSMGVNQPLLKKLADAGTTVRQYFPDAQTDLLAILAWPGMLDLPTLKLESASSPALELLQQAINDLVQMRQNEGAQIKIFIQQRLEAILAEVAIIEKQLPELLEVEKQRLALRVTELGLGESQQRVEQEMALLIQKTDVSEEIQRLISHCQAMDTTLALSGSMGRRLDFLSQELHREANTLSSKALNVSLTNASIEIRVLIEQIREQVQNIE